MPEGASSSVGKVLIVDDDLLICSLLEKCLQREGYATVVAGSGEDALQVAALHRPDLIILDILLPGMNGYETCEALRRDPRTSHTPIIFLTSKNDPDDLARGLDLGAADYISKPFRSAELVARLRARLKFARERARHTQVLPAAGASAKPQLLPVNANSDPDVLAAKLLIESGMICSAQLEQAQTLVSNAAERGLRMPLLDALTNLGSITEAQRESAVKKIEALERGGIHQLGGYRLMKKLGEGGMGSVYLGEEVATGRQVALKVLSPRYKDDLEFVARFRREANAMKSLNHPNIAAAYTVDEHAGLHFFAMELCEGEALDKLIEREGPFAWRRAALIISQAAEGLAYAHERGLLHRDIKPGNIMVSPSGAVKILDFGLLKKFEQIQQSVVTEAGTTLGTPDYIAPEQVRSEPFTDGRADIYSLGGTFYHMLTANPPYGSGAPALILLKHLNEPVPDPRKWRSDIPDPVALIVRKMMAKEPADRFFNCNELVRELESVLARIP